MIIEERLAHISTLKSGGHSEGEAMCAMEAVAYIAGEPWSDHPQCASPVIAAFMRSWNDSLPSDAERERLLLPLIPKLVGTRGSEALEHRRSLMAADWLVRVHTPAWLRLAGLEDQALSLEGLPEITSMAQVPSIRGPIEAVRIDAEAARDAAEVAAWDVAWDAARAAAGAAARAKLKPTQDALQQSALALVERMISAEEV